VIHVHRDQHAHVQHRFKAVVEEFTAVANSNGQIVIARTYGPAGNPLASGIEVIQ